MKAVDVDKLDELGIGILRELRGSVGLTDEPVVREDTTGRRAFTG